MTVDYPDWTRLIQLIGTNIMLPIDIQGSYIMMPMDLQGASITLDINILTSEATIDIAIDAANVTGNIAVDIKAHSIENLTIIISSQNVGIYSQPEWVAGKDEDKNLSGYATCPDGEGTFVIDHEVEDSGTFYICQWGFGLTADCGGFASLWYRHNTTDKRLAMIGGRMGNAQSFNKPIAVVLGDHIKLSVFQKSGGNVVGYGSVGGYQI